MGVRETLSCTLDKQWRGEVEVVSCMSPHYRICYWRDGEEESKLDLAREVIED